MLVLCTLYENWHIKRCPNWTPCIRRAPPNGALYMNFTILFQKKHVSKSENPTYNCLNNLILNHLGFFRLSYTNVSQYFYSNTLLLKTIHMVYRLKFPILQYLFHCLLEYLFPVKVLFLNIACYIHSHLSPL